MPGFKPPTPAYPGWAGTFISHGSRKASVPCVVVPGAALSGTSAGPAPANGRHPGRAHADCRLLSAHPAFSDCSSWEPKLRGEAGLG